MKNILVIFFLFLCYNVVAQRLPSGIPNQFSTGWFKQGYQQSDSGTIIANRDTTWLPKYSGTIVFRPADKKLYYFDSLTLSWKQINSGNNRFAIEDSITSQNRLFNAKGYTFTIDSFSSFDLYSKVQSSGVDRGVIGHMGVSPTSSYLWNYHSNGISTRSYGFNAYAGLTQMFAVGHLSGHATYVQTDTSQVILESDPNRLYMFHDSVALININGGEIDFRIRTLPSTNDTTTYKPTVMGPQGQLKRMVGWPTGGGGGSGTVTSVALSVPSAFTVSGSPITTSGTFNISGAGTTAQYIRGNGTLATTDTGMIPNFYLKARSLFSGTLPITYNSTTGAIGITNANTSGTKGAATFNNSNFSDNGSGLISLSTLVTAGSCTGCVLNIGTDGRITGYSDGAGGATNNVNIGAGFRPVNAITQEMRTYFAGFGNRLDTVANTDGITWSADTTRLTGLPTYYYIDSLGSENISNTSLTANGNYYQNWNHKQWYVDSIAGSFLFRTGGIGSGGTRRKGFRINWGGNSFGDNLDGYNVMSYVNKSDNSGDSLQLGMISSGLGTLSLGVYDATLSNRNTFISYSTVGLINISARDSIWIKGAIPAATADSIVGLQFRSPGVSKVVKIPFTGGGGGSAVTGDTVVYMSRSAGIVSDANIGAGSTTFGTDNTTAAQAVLDIASHTQGLQLIWDVRISVTGLRIGPNTYIKALPSYGAILRNNSDKPLFRNRDTAFAREPEDSNIVVEGGIWNGNSYNASLNPAQAVGTPSNGTTAVFSFYGVRNLIVRDFTILRQRTYAIAGNNLKNALYENGVVDAGNGGIFSDGVHFDGNSEHCTARNLKIRAIDDAVGINADDAYDNPSSPVYGYFPAGAAGPVSDIEISDIFLDNGQFGVRLLSGSSRIDNVRIRNITGSTIGYAVLLDNFWQDTSVIVNSGPGNIGSVQVENVNVDITGLPAFPVNPAMVSISANVENILLKDLKRFSYSYPGLPTVRVTGSYYDIGTLIIDGYEAMDTTSAGIEHILFEDATINSLTLQRINIKRLSQGSGCMGSNNATIKNIQINDVLLDSINYVYFNSNSTVSNININGVHHISRLFGTYNTINNSGGTVSYIAFSNYSGGAATSGVFGAKIGDAFPASTTQAGYVTTTTQSFAGDKEFVGRTQFTGAIKIPMPIENSFISGYTSVTTNDAILLNNTSLGATVGIQNNSATGFSGIEYLSETGVSKVFSGLNNANGQEFRFNNFTSGGYISFLTGGNEKVRVNNSAGISLNQLTAPIASYNVLVHGLTDSVVYQVPVSAFGGTQTWQQTLTTGSTLTGANTITGGNNSFTWNGMFNFRINSNSFILDKSTPASPYSHTVLGVDNRYQLGFTPTATVYSKGVAIIIDSNNNVGLGVQMPTTAPLYGSGTNGYANNLLVEGGVFVGVANITSNTTLDLEKHFVTIDATGGNVTVTLPAASTAFGASVGIQYIFKRLDNSGNTVTVSRAGSDTIDGATSFTLTTQYESKSIIAISTSAWGVF